MLRHRIDDICGTRTAVAEQQRQMLELANAVRRNDLSVAFDDIDAAWRLPQRERQFFDNAHGNIVRIAPLHIRRRDPVEFLQALAGRLNVDSEDRLAKLEAEGDQDGFRRNATIAREVNLRDAETRIIDESDIRSPHASEGAPDRAANKQ